VNGRLFTVGEPSCACRALALAYPDITLRGARDHPRGQPPALLIAFSFWFILVGIGDIVEAMEATDNRGWMGLLGVVTIVAGMIILANPDIGLTTLALLVGIRFLVRGTLEIVVGFTLRGTRGATP
jgi:uncharacterized membrane protein HdeD (DUF308 family)